MMQDRPPASVQPQEIRSAVAAPGDAEGIGRHRAVLWARQGQDSQAWNGFLFDAAEIARGAVVFMGLTGCFVVVLWALMRGS
jgi:hypothetical protein